MRENDELNTNHDTVQLSIIVTRDTSGAVEIKPAFLAFTNAKNSLMDVTATVEADVAQCWLHVPAVSVKHRSVITLIMLHRSTLCLLTL